MTTDGIEWQISFLKVQWRSKKGTFCQKVTKKKEEEEKKEFGFEKKNHHQEDKMDVSFKVHPPPCIHDKNGTAFFKQWYKIWKKCNMGCLYQG